MSETKTEAKAQARRGYRESENFVPSAMDQSDVLHTAGVGGHHRIEQITPVFEQARLADLELAKRALDPDDPTPEYHVTLPTGQLIAPVDPEAAKERVIRRADAAEAWKAERYPEAAAEDREADREARADDDTSAADARASAADARASSKAAAKGHRYEDPSAVTVEGDETPAGGK